MKSTMFNGGERSDSTTKNLCENRRMRVPTVVMADQHDGRVGVKFPYVEVRYENIRVVAKCEVVHGKPLPTIWNYTFGYCRNFGDEQPIGMKFLSVEVRYENIHVVAECEVVHGKPLPTIWNFLQYAFSTVQAYFKLEKPISFLISQITRLEYDISGEIGVPGTQV
ncbi:hypothetical protein HanHA89_Chr04g0159161 [Helianthus annuus]|nr:hypothetical protein HanHA89_Chr04g0159161 [Helianthus annuus]